MVNVNWIPGPMAEDTSKKIDIERLILGENSIEGTIRVLIYIVAFAALFGTISTFLR